MNEKQFLTKVIQLYHKARESRFPNPKIRRGRSHSIASDAEDLFALFLVEKVKCDLIYVDQPISVKGYNAQIYPDIVIVRNKKIKALCDIKIDLGWKRTKLYDLCRNYDLLLEKIRGKECKIKDKECKIKNGLTKVESFCFDKNVSYNVVIVTDQNIPKRILEDQKTKLRQLKYVKVFILTSGEHPNTYGIGASKLVEKISIRKQVFVDLLKTLNIEK